MKKLLIFAVMTAVAVVFAACSDSEEKKLPEAPAEATPRAETASVPAPWTDSMEEALSRAKEENKVIFALFTAPEWCGFCRILEEKVLSKDDFTEKASEFAVLLMLDYSAPDKLPAAQKEALLKLQRQYRVSGYPTMYVLDSQGRVLGNIPNTRDLTTETLLEKMKSFIPAAAE